MSHDLFFRGQLRPCDSCGSWRTFGGNMNTKFVFTAVAALAFFFSGCGSSPQNLIVGKWEAGQGAIKMTMEFYSNGKAKLGMFGQSIDATYKINGGDELEWTC